MRILALDTSSAAGSAAVVESGVIAIERVGDGARTHGERLPRELMLLLEEARLRLDDIDAYAVGTGPGSYTGLRIGIATIQGLALAQGKQVTAVSGFDALVAATAASSSRSAPAGSPRAVWIDAHRGEVFAMLYDGDGSVLHAPTSLPPAATLERWAASLAGARAVMFAGDGAIKYREIIEAQLGRTAEIPAVVPPLAGAIGVLAAQSPERAGPPHAVVPLYVRRSDVELLRDRRTAAGGA